MSDATPETSLPFADRLYGALQGFLELNPEAACLQTPRLFQLAVEVDPADFPRFADFANRLLNDYVDSPWKRSGRTALNEYGQIVQLTARLLDGAEGKGEETPPDTTAPDTLLPVAREATAEQWCRILGQTTPPAELSRAAEAYRRRNTHVGTVLEPMFAILQLIDDRQAFEWGLALANQAGGSLDPDVIRDLLKAWNRHPKPPHRVLDQACAWSADTGLQREWPGVIHQADLLLRRAWLQRWRATSTPRNRQLRALVVLVDRDRVKTRELLSWQDSTLNALGEALDFFVRVTRPPAEDEESQTPDRAWARAAAEREIDTIEELFPIVILLSDVVLGTPDGPARLAQIFFGFTPHGKERWRTALIEYSERVVRRLFLNALREHQPAEPIIRALSFRDESLFNELLGSVDQSTRQFHNLADRDYVVRRLAVYYASFRETEFFGREITRRYRQLMRMLHEDSLRALLSPEIARRVTGSDALRELAALASEARRFLARRRDLSMPLHDLLAAEQQFSEHMRAHRIHRIRATVLA